MSSISTTALTSISFTASKLVTVIFAVQLPLLLTKFILVRSDFAQLLMIVIGPPFLWQLPLWWLLWSLHLPHALLGYSTWPRCPAFHQAATLLGRQRLHTDIALTGFTLLVFFSNVPCLHWTCLYSHPQLLWKVTNSRLVAVQWHVLTYRNLLLSVNFAYFPLGLLSPVTLLTASLAYLMVAGLIEVNKGPLGSGRPSISLKYL